MLALRHPVIAQTGVTWSADASLGLADHHGGEIHDPSANAARLALSARKFLRPSVGLDAEFAYDWIGPFPGSSDLVCHVDSRGRCMADFPNIAGPVGLVGVSFGTANVDARVNAGMAAYRVDGRDASYLTRLGAPLMETDVALAPASWFAIVAGERAFLFPNLNGDRVLITTFHLGVRFRSRQPS